MDQAETSNKEVYRSNKGTNEGVSVTPKNNLLNAKIMKHGSQNTLSFLDFVKKNAPKKMSHKKYKTNEKRRSSLIDKVCQHSKPQGQSSFLLRKKLETGGSATKRLIGQKIKMMENSQNYIMGQFLKFPSKISIHSNQGATACSNGLNDVPSVTLKNRPNVFNMRQRTRNNSTSSSEYLNFFKGHIMQNSSCKEYETNQHNSSSSTDRSIEGEKYKETFKKNLMCQASLRSGAAHKAEALNKLSAQERASSSSNLSTQNHFSQNSHDRSSGRENLEYKNVERLNNTKKRLRQTTLHSHFKYIKKHCKRDSDLDTSHWTRKDRVSAREYLVKEGNKNDVEDFCIVRKATRSPYLSKFPSETEEEESEKKCSAVLESFMKQSPNNKFIFGKPGTEIKRYRIPREKIQQNLWSSEGFHESLSKHSSSDVNPGKEDNAETNTLSSLVYYDASQSKTTIAQKHRGKSETEKKECEKTAASDRNPETLSEILGVLKSFGESQQSTQNHLSPYLNQKSFSSKIKTITSCQNKVPESVLDFHSELSNNSESIQNNLSPYLNQQSFSSKINSTTSCENKLPESSAHFFSEHSNDPELFLNIDPTVGLKDDCSIAKGSKGTLECDIVRATFSLKSPENTKKDIKYYEKIVDINVNPSPSHTESLQAKKQEQKCANLDYGEEFNKPTSSKAVIAAPMKSSEPISVLDTETQNSSKTSISIYSLTESSILYHENLLKQLVEEKKQIVKSYKKFSLKVKPTKGPKEVLAKTYIKRYRKGKVKIFAVKKRYKPLSTKRYQPPEHKFVEKLTQRCEDTSTDTSIDRESISTPTSYTTDDTTSEVLSTNSENLTGYQKVLRERITALSRDPKLLFSRFADEAPEEVDRFELLTSIQKVILDLLEDFENGRVPYFNLLGNHFSNCTFKNDRYQIRENPQCTKIVSGRKGKVINARFNLILFILNRIRILLETNTKLPKREIYYLLKTMVRSQTHTDSAIKTISKMLGVGPWALHLTSQKGLVYGDLKIVLSNGDMINCNVPGTSVPVDVSDICEVHTNAYFILVVEKESVFHKLLEEDLPKRLPRSFILITAKGFPDYGTQFFLKKLWMVIQVPVFILVDADPDGISIMLNYRFGSMASAHISEHLTIPKAKWLGVFPSEIQKFDGDGIALTKRDIKKINDMLQWPCVQENVGIKKQLQTMLNTDMKMGIEGLTKPHNTFLSHQYLNVKLLKRDFI